MSDDKQKEYAELMEKVTQSMKLLAEAEKFADLHGLSFTIDPAYGMGGTYNPKLTEEQRQAKEEAGEWVPSEGWQPSSQSC